MQEMLDKVQNTLNNRPRNVLNFLKLDEIMNTLIVNSKRVIQSLMGIFLNIRFCRLLPLFIVARKNHGACPVEFHYHI